MSRVKTTEGFVAEATAKHNGRYSYELVDYKKSQENVEITCVDHGGFTQRPNNHLSGAGCPACKKIAMSKFFRKDNKDFIAEARETHGDLYDYTKTVYDGVSEGVTITCRVHGDFTQLPNHHINGCGCSKCSYAASGAERSLGIEGFIEKSRAVHGDKYEYGDVSYTNGGVKVSITCSKHGSFSMAPSCHISGQGCGKCGHRSITQDEFISKAKEIHTDKYEYSEVVYSGVTQHVSIICKEHGPFLQIPYVHLRGSGCGSCAVTGFDCGRSGTFYVMTCGNMTKVGITNKTALERARRIGGSYGEAFMVAKEIKFDSGRDCYDLEVKVLRKLRLKYDTPSKKFDGSTEVFINVDRAWLEEQIETLGVENVQ